MVNVVFNSKKYGFLVLKNTNCKCACIQKIHRFAVQEHIFMMCHQNKYKRIKIRNKRK